MTIPVPFAACSAVTTDTLQAAREGRAALALGDGRWLVRDRPWSQALQARGIEPEHILQWVGLTGAQRAALLPALSAK